MLHFPAHSRRAILQLCTCVCGWSLAFCCLWQLLSQDPGVYTLFLKADDNVRLWINQELLIDKWWTLAGDSYGNITLTAGRLNDVRIEYRDR
jgi:hypothetical protein